jgi:hypothetical protein
MPAPAVHPAFWVSTLTALLTAPGLPSASKPTPGKTHGAPDRADRQAAGGIDHDVGA